MAEDDVLTFEQLRNLQQQEREKDTLHDLDDDFFERAKDYLDRKQRIGDFKSNKEYRNARQIIEDIIDAREKKIIRLAFLSVTSGVSVDNLLSEEELLFDQVRESIREHRNDITGRLFGDGQERETGRDASSSEEQDTETGDTTGSSGTDTDEAGGDKTPGEQTDRASSEELETEQEEGVGKGSKDSGEDGSGPEQGASKDKTQDGEEYSEEEEGDTVLFGGGDDEQEGDNEETDESDELVEVAIQEEVPAFMGVDMESYGPFNAGEEVMIPEENAEVLEEQGSAERLD